MKTVNMTPIFCDDCPELAMADLDGAPLCDVCLKKMIIDDSQNRLIDKIAPLIFVASQRDTRDRASLLTENEYQLHIGNTL